MTAPGIQASLQRRPRLCFRESGVPVSKGPPSLSPQRKPRPTDATRGGVLALQTMLSVGPWLNLQSSYQTRSRHLLACA